MYRTPLNVASLREQLSGLPLHRLDVVETTGSTNADLLARHAAGEDIAGAVLLAEDQSAGRGRNGRSWTAPPRSQIALSIGVRAEGVPPTAWGWLPLLTGVALVDAIRETTGIQAGVKWPNDVLVGTGKLAGILAEVASPDPVIVVGLGVNVTLTPEEAPDPRATSLQMLGASMLDRDVLAAAILRELITESSAGRASTAPTRLSSGTTAGTASPWAVGCGPSCRVIAKSSAPQHKSTRSVACSSTPTPRW